MATAPRTDISDNVWLITNDASSNNMPRFCCYNLKCNNTASLAMQPPRRLFGSEDVRNPYRICCTRCAANVVLYYAFHTGNGGPWVLWDTNGVIIELKVTHTEKPFPVATAAACPADS